MLPSVPLLRKRRAKFVVRFDRTFGVAPVLLVGKDYDKLVDLVFRFVKVKGEFDLELSDIGDGSVVDEEQADTDLINSRTQSIKNLLTHWAGRSLGFAERRKLAIEVTGQREYIRSGTVALGGWTGFQPGQCLLYVKDIRRVNSWRGRRYEVEVDAYHGEPAGNSWVCNMSGGFLQQLLRDVGCGKYEKHHDEDISGTWFVADVSRDKAGHLLMESVQVSGAQKKYNRQLGKVRKAPCVCKVSPLKGKVCRPCPMDRSICPRARYAVAYMTKRDCINGHPGLFRADVEEDYCFHCIQRGDFIRGRNPGQS